jgi:hypothetical protein
MRSCFLSATVGAWFFFIQNALFLFPGDPYPDHSLGILSRHGHAGPEIRRLDVISARLQ